MKLYTKILTIFAMSAGVVVSAQAEAPKNTPYTLKNKHLGRELSVVDGHLTTSKILNYRADSVIQPQACDEFSLRISGGTDKVGTDVVLTTAWVL